MIIRQFCARHGRSALSRSSGRPKYRAFASDADKTSIGHSGLSREALIHQPASGSITSSKGTSATNDAAIEALLPKTSQLEDLLGVIGNTTKSIQADVDAHVSSRLLSLPEESSSYPPLYSANGIDQSLESLEEQKSTKKVLPKAPFSSIALLNEHRKKELELSQLGTHTQTGYDPIKYLLDPPTPSALTLPMLLSSQTHLGHATSLWNPRNSSYIFGIRDGIHIISLDITASYLRRAAKVVTEIARRGGIILFIGTRDGQEDIVVNAAKLSGGYHIFDRWTPGSLTNGQQILGHCKLKVVDILDRELTEYSAQLAESATNGSHPVLRPDLVICLNPIENEVCLHECGLYNVPTIGIIDTDADPSWVTYPIPANDDSLRSVTLLAGVLGRAGEEGQRLRMEEAKRGVATYSTRKARDYITALEELQAVQEGETTEETA